MLTPCTLYIDFLRHGVGALHTYTILTTPTDETHTLHTTHNPTGGSLSRYLGPIHAITQIIPDLLQTKSRTYAIHTPQMDILNIFKDIQTKAYLGKPSNRKKLIKNLADTIYYTLFSGPHHTNKRKDIQDILTTAAVSDCGYNLTIQNPTHVTFDHFYQQGTHHTVPWELDSLTKLPVTTHTPIEHRFDDLYWNTPLPKL